MAHFAELDENNVVLRVCVVSNDIGTSDGPLGENDKHIDGETWCTNFWGGTWKQTSYNKNFRKNYACEGMVYDEGRDIFRVKQPYPSFSLNENNVWEGPVPYPTIDDFDCLDHEGNTVKQRYNIWWNEDRQEWKASSYAGAAGHENKVFHTWNTDTLSWGDD